MQLRNIKNSLFRCKRWFLFSIATLFIAQASYGQTFVNLTGPPTLVSGTALQQGAVYRYSAALPGIDVLVTLAQFVSTTTSLTNIDDNTANAPRFQPVITCAGTAAANASSQCYVRFDFQFVTTATSTPALVYGLAATAQDVDGNSVANGVREFVEFTNSTAVNLAAVTNEVSLPPLAGGIRYGIDAPTNVQAGIGTGNNYEIYAKYASAISSFSMLAGNIVGTAGCLSTAAECQRQNSYSFLPFDSNVPSLTVRKVSNAGTGTFTFTGTNGWATQPVSTAVAGATVTSQSEALLVPATATTLTESAPTGFTLESITCTGLAAGGTATPTINGTGGGSVLLNAAATTVAAPGTNIVCTFVNRKLTANIAISKTNGTNTLVAGSTTTYTIVATNGGPDNAQGATVSDPVSAGLSCTTSSCVGAGGAVCPTPAVTAASQLQAGVIAGSFPPSSSLTFTLTCGVIATGQ